MKGGMIMRRSFNKKYFNTVLTITRWVTKVLVVVLFILIGVILISVGVVMFLPVELFDYDLGELAYVESQYLEALLEIKPELFTGIVNMKWLLVFGLFTILINISFLQFIFIMLKNAIIDVTNEKPFSEKNIIRFNFIGIAFIVSGIILPIFNVLLLNGIINMLSFENVKVNYSLDLQQIFIGLLIIVLANILEYGAIRGTQKEFRKGD